jgi:restriction system protein
MALWLYRTGRYGEHEQKFLKDSRIYLTWEELADCDPTKLKHYDEIKDILRKSQLDSSERRIGNHAGQVWSFISAMKPSVCAYSL